MRTDHKSNPLVLLADGIGRLLNRLWHSEAVKRADEWVWWAIIVCYATGMGLLLVWN